MKTAFHFYGFVYTDGLCGNCRREQICATLGSVLKSKKYICLNDSPFFHPVKYAKINAQKCVSQTVHLSQKDCSMSNNGSSPLVLWYNQLGMNDVDRVGAKMPPWVK